MRDKICIGALLITVGLLIVACLYINDYYSRIFDDIDYSVLTEDMYETVTNSEGQPVTMEHKEQNKVSIDSASDLKNHIGKLNSQITSLNGQVGQLNSEIAGLKGQVATLSDSNYGIKANGRLKVIGNKLCNEKGQPFQLKGMSTHGITWFPRYTGTATFNSLKDYGANVVRLAVCSELPGSYTYMPEENMDVVYNAIGNALSVNMYVIVDWHVLTDANPNKYKDKAKKFFQEVSAYYKDEPGIIYEICNEPNGSKVTWNEIVSYANEIIPIIRKNAPNSLIIVGTPGYSFDVEDAAANPLKFSNIMYTFHAYVDVTYNDTSDMNWLERKLALNLPIFVTEWGVNYEGAKGSLYETRAMKLVEYMKKHNISWCMWALSNKDEDHAMFKTTCNKYSNWTESDLTFTGKVAVKALKY